MIISALQDAMKSDFAEFGQIINSDQPEQIKKLARRLTPKESADKIAGCFEALGWIEASVNERLIFEQLLLNLAISDKMNA